MPVVFCFVGGLVGCRDGEEGGAAEGALCEEVGLSA